jgi:hypothetical protein
MTYLLLNLTHDSRSDKEVDCNTDLLLLLLVLLVLLLLFVIFMQRIHSYISETNYDSREYHVAANL